MPAPSQHESSRSLWILGFLIWTTLALMSAAQNAAWRAFGGVPVGWYPLVPTSLADWYTCGIFTPVVFWMARRFPLRARRWWRYLPVHLGSAFLVVLGKVTLYTPIFGLLHPLQHRTFGNILFDGFFADYLAYWATLGVSHAVIYSRESRRQQVEAARLDGALRAAELENLKTQLQPHFLFNTLQSISTLIYRDAPAADRMLTALANLLRASLRHTAAQEVPLRDELAFVSQYVDIMRTRFGDRLEIAIDVPPDLLDANVPSLVLQPIVENAIRHGIADRTDRGHVTITARRADRALQLDIADDGPGLPATQHNGEGNNVGLTNTRERIARLYGPDGSVETLAADRAGNGHQGLTVRLTVPLSARREAPA